MGSVKEDENGYVADQKVERAATTAATTLNKEST